MSAASSIARPEPSPHTDPSAALVKHLTQYARSMDEMVRQAYGDHGPDSYKRWREQEAARQAPRICSLRGCHKRHYGRGYCRSHYDRWRRHGDPLGGYWPRTGPPPTPAEILRECWAAYAAALVEAVGE